MKSLFTHSVRNIVLAVSVLVLVVAVYVSNAHSLKVSIAESAGVSNVSGYVWSENIGWISLNSTTDSSTTPYGVSVDTATFPGGTGSFSGYAWSENIGWISFNRADTGNPPDAPYQAGVGADPIAKIDWTTGRVTGWAKALAAADGWDGWIKLSKENTDASSDYSTMVNITTGPDRGKLTGWAWGSDVVGWIDMAAVTKLDATLPAAKVDLPQICTAPQVDIDNGWNPICDVTPTDLATCTSGTTVLSGTTTGYCSAGGFATKSCTTTCSGAGWKPASGVGTCTPPNGICETGETTLSCPQDCKPKIKEF